MNVGSVIIKVALILALILAHGMARSLPPGSSLGSGTQTPQYPSGVSAS
jgi:hypothetical protein